MQVIHRMWKRQDAVAAPYRSSLGPPMNKGVTQLPSRASGSADRIDRIVLEFGRLVLIAAGAMAIFVGVCLLPILFRFASPPLYDYNLLHLDEILAGGHPTFVVAHFAAIHPMVLSFMMAVYAALPYALAVMFILASYFPRKIHPVSALLFIVGTACAGAAVYFLCPGGGPKVCAHSLGVTNFPLADITVTTLRTIPCPIGAPFNATPSLHCAWAILFLLALRPFGRWMTIATSIFVVLTAISTMAIGEHYAVDLIASLPFTLAVYAVVNRRYVPASIGAVTIILWQLSARFLQVAGPAFVILVPAALLCGVYLFGDMQPRNRTQASKSKPALCRSVEAVQ